MPSFVQEIDLSDEEQLVEHFQNIPDMTEYILESERYPLDALNQAVRTVADALRYGDLDTVKAQAYERTISKIESVVSTRVDYVNSMIDYLLGKETFETPSFSLEESTTKDILFHLDVIKDVARAPEIDHDEYKLALKKFLNTLKFRFNRGLEIHKRLYNLAFEDLAEKRQDFPRSVLEEHRNFLEDALAMTRSHVPAKPIQIHQLKETLFKILEAMGVRTLQSHDLHVRSEYNAILKQIEDLIAGLELDFGQKLVDRFSDLLPEYIADHWNFDVIKHNRKIMELLIDCTEDAALLSDLYKILINLTSAEAVQYQRKQELSRVTLKNIRAMEYVKDEENAVLAQMQKFKALEPTEQARDLIKLSVYGLCEYISKLSVAGFSKYPIGIIKSAEKMLKDLTQHRLKDSDVQSIRGIPEYQLAVETIEGALQYDDVNNEKYNFVDIYKEADFTVDGITYCAFNDIVLRLIQNIMEAYFVADSDEQKVSDGRIQELKITIAGRYEREWMRQTYLRQESDQLAMEELAAEML